MLMKNYSLPSLEAGNAKSSERNNKNRNWQLACSSAARQLHAVASRWVCQLSTRQQLMMDVDYDGRCWAAVEHRVGNRQQFVASLGHRLSDSQRQPNAFLVLY